MNNRKYLLFLIFGIIIYTVVFTSLCSLRYQAFFSYEWEDEAAENQLLWNTAHGKFLNQTIHPTKSGFFVDHFSPVYILVSILYAIYPRIYTIYFLISLSFALGAIPIYYLARRMLDNHFQAFILAVTYLCYSPLHWVNVTAIEPVMFSAPFLLFTFYFFYERRFRPFLIFLVLSLMTKENISLIAVMFGLYAIVKKRDLKWGMTSLLIGVAWFAVSVWGILPWISSVEGSPFHGFMLDSPKVNFWMLIQRIFSDAHLLFFKRIFSPVLFLSLFSFEWLMALPIFLQIGLTVEAPANVWSYSVSPIIAFTFIGLIFSFGYIKRLIGNTAKIRSKIKPALINGLLLGVMISSLYSNFGSNIIGFRYEDEIKDSRFHSADNIYDKRFYAKDADDFIAWELIKLIPDDASVAASGDLLVPLSHRTKLLEFAHDDVGEGGGQDYYNVDYILIHKKSLYHGNGHYAEVKQEHLDAIKKLVDDGTFFVVSQKNNFILLKRV